MVPDPETVQGTLVFTSTGDLFMFIGVLVCIGAIGAIAVYKLIRDFFYN